MFPPPTRSLTRVETLPLIGIAAYIYSYHEHCKYYAPGTIVLALGEGNNKNGKHKKQASEVLDFAKLDKCYHSIDPLNVKKYTMRQVSELLAWIQLKSLNPSSFIRYIERNKESVVTNTFERAQDFLIKNQSRLLFSSNKESKPWEERAMEVVPACMRILCELEGVGVLEASAIVAAWHPFGIFMSDALVKNLFGEDVQPIENWLFFKNFYKEALKALKVMYRKGIITCGRDMEKVEWSMYHAYKNPNAGSPAEQGEEGLETRTTVADHDKRQQERKEEHESRDGQHKDHQKQQSGKNQDSNRAKTLPSAVDAVQEQDVDATLPAVAQLSIVGENEANATLSNLASLKPSLNSEAGEELSVGSSLSLASTQTIKEVDDSTWAPAPSTKHTTVSEMRKTEKEKKKHKDRRTGSKSCAQQTLNINLTICVPKGPSPNMYFTIPTTGPMLQDKERQRSRGKVREGASEGTERAGGGRKRSKQATSSQA